MRKMKGASLAQYAIVIACVILGCTVIYSFVGQNIVTILNKYNIIFGGISDNAKSNLINTNALLSSITPPAHMDYPSLVSTYSLDINGSGDATFNVSGQDVTLPADVLNLVDVAIETSGTNGIENIIPEIAYMINMHKDEYPEGDVPLEIMFGNSSRTVGPTTFLGDCQTTLPSISSTTLKVGNHIVVLQKDQSAIYASIGPAPPGVEAHRIEGYLTNPDTLTGFVSSNDEYNDKILDFNIDFSNSISSSSLASSPEVVSSSSSSVPVSTSLSSLEPASPAPPEFSWDLSFYNDYNYEL